MPNIINIAHFSTSNSFPTLSFQPIDLKTKFNYYCYYFFHQSVPIHPVNFFIVLLLFQNYLLSLHNVRNITILQLVSTRAISKNFVCLFLCFVFFPFHFKTELNIYSSPLYIYNTKTNTFDVEHFILLAQPVCRSHAY